MTCIYYSTVFVGQESDTASLGLSQATIKVVFSSECSPGEATFKFMPVVLGGVQFLVVSVSPELLAGGFPQFLVTWASLHSISQHGSYFIRVSKHKGKRSTRERKSRNHRLL